MPPSIGIEFQQRQCRWEVACQNNTPILTAETSQMTVHHRLGVIFFFFPSLFVYYCLFSYLGILFTYFVTYWCLEERPPFFPLTSAYMYQQQAASTPPSPDTHHNMQHHYYHQWANGDNPQHALWSVLAKSWPLHRQPWPQPPTPCADGVQVWGLVLFINKNEYDGHHRTPQ